MSKVSFFQQNFEMGNKQIYFLALMLATFVVASFAEPLPESEPESEPEGEPAYAGKRIPDSGSASIYGAHALTLFISSLAYVLFK